MMGLSVFRCGFTPAVGLAEYSPPSSNRVLWLNPNDATTLDAATGMTAAVDDKSVAGNHGTTPSGKPLGLRGNPLAPTRRMLRCEGGSGADTCRLNINGLASTLNTTTWTLFFVAAGPKLTTGNATIFAAGASAGANPVIQIATDAGKWRLFVRNAAATTAQANTAANNDANLHVWCLVYDGIQIKLRMDGGQVANLGWTSANTTNRVCFGALERTTVAQGADVLIGTVLCYSTAMSLVDIQLVEAALTAQEIPAITNGVPVPANFFPAPKLARPTLSGAAYSSTYATDFHRAHASLTTYYVDPVTGNNANAGTSAGTALKDMNTALAKSDVQCVVLAAGIYTQNEAWTTYSRPNRSVIIECQAGRAVVGKFETPTWTLTATRTYTYQHTLAGTVLRAYDATARDADGLPTVLTLRSSVADVEANPGSYYISGGVIYAHAADSRAADRSILVALTAPTNPTLPFTAAGHFAVMRNIDFVGVWINSDVSGANYYLDSVHALWGPEQSNSNCYEIYRIGCKTKYIEVSGGASDCFDYRLSAIGLEQNCVAKNQDTGDTTNCSTAHDSSIVMRVACDYSGGARVVHDIVGTRTWALGCSAINATTGGANTDHGWTCGDIGIASTAQMWLDGCSASGNAIDLYVGNGATMRYRNMTIGSFATTIESGGVLASY